MVSWNISKDGWLASLLGHMAKKSGFLLRNGTQDLAPFLSWASFVLQNFQSSLNSPLMHLTKHPIKIFDTNLSFRFRRNKNMILCSIWCVVTKYDIKCFLNFSISLNCKHYFSKMMPNFGWFVDTQWKSVKYSIYCILSEIFFYIHSCLFRCLE